MPALRVVHVALYLARRDRHLRKPAVVEALRVARVLPRLVVEPALGARARVLDEPIAVAIAVLVDPAQSCERRLAELVHERRVVRPSPGLREQDEEERRRIGSAVVAVEPLRRALPRRTSCTIFPGSASRDGSSSVACSAASSRSAERASSGPKSIVCRHVISVSRPNTVMNHGIPAAGSLPPPASSAVRMRSAARSLTDWPNVWRSSFHDARRSAARAAPTPRPTRATLCALLAEVLLDDLRSASRARRRSPSPTSMRSDQRLARRELEVVADSVAVTSPRSEKITCVRPKPSGSTSMSWLFGSSYTAATAGGSGFACFGSPSEKSHSLTEMMSAKSAATTRSSRSVERLRRLVRQLDVILHAVADEALALDQHAVERQTVATADCAGSTRPRSTRRCRDESSSGRLPSMRQLEPREEARVVGEEPVRRLAHVAAARRRCRTSSLRGSSVGS